MVNQSSKRYTWEFGGSMLAYVLVLIASLWMLQWVSDSPWRILLALLPVIPVIFALIAFLRYLSRMDELQQRIQLNAIGFAAGATGLVTFTYGFLENVGFPHLSWIWILPMMIFFWGMGGAIASWRYR